MADSSGRRRTTARQYSAEDQALNQIANEAEHRLAARRAARQEAREIRMREIERQQKELEEKERQNGQKKRGLSSAAPTATPTRHISTPRQESEESSDDLRSIKKELYQLEEKYTKAMMDNAQLDNEKQMLRYDVDLMKDRLEDLSEEHIELTREHKDKCREFEKKKRENTDLQDEVGYLKQQLQHRDQLIEQYGLVFLSNDTVADEEDADRHRAPSTTDDDSVAQPALVTPEAREILQKHAGSLDDRLRSFDTAEKGLREEIKKLKLELDQEKERSNLAEKYSTPRMSRVSNGPDVSEIQMESQRLINEYKFKLKKAEQDITTLEGNVMRLESQAKRYKQAADNSEKNEEELKGEKRKLQREFREAQNQIEELQSQNQHLQKRMEKMKSARNAILKS